MNEEVNSEPSSGRRYLIFIILAAASLFVMWFGMEFVEQQLKPPEVAIGLRVGTFLPKPKPLLPVRLVDQDGKPFTLDALQGRWTFLAIGYTSCPDVCPTLMATFKAMNKLLNPEGTKPVVDFMFVSVDPERDSPEQLGRYVHYFNPSFMGVTGSSDDLRSLSGQFGLMYRRSEASTSKMGYMIDHSASMVLIDPNVAWTAVFTPPHNPQNIATDTLTIMARYKTAAGS